MDFEFWGLKKLLEESQTITSLSVRNATLSEDDAKALFAPTYVLFYLCPLLKFFLSFPFLLFLFFPLISSLYISLPPPSLPNILFIYIYRNKITTLTIYPEEPIPAAAFEVLFLIQFFIFFFLGIERGYL